MSNKLYFFKNSNKPIKVKVLYNKEDMSISSKPIYMSDVSIMTGAAYLGLELNLSNMLIVSMWGCCHKRCWKRTELTPPANVEDGEIMLKTDRELIAGIAIDLEKETPIYFCEKNNWICIGDKNISNYDCNIRFMENAIMSLKHNECKAIWINPKYE